MYNSVESTKSFMEMKRKYTSQLCNFKLLFSTSKGFLYIFNMINMGGKYLERTI